MIGLIVFLKNLKVIFRRAGKVKITLYSLLGGKVLTLINADYDKGSFSVPWDGLDREGKHMKKGVYIYTIESPDGKKSGKVKLSK